MVARRVWACALCVALIGCDAGRSDDRGDSPAADSDDQQESKKKKKKKKKKRDDDATTTTSARPVKTVGGLPVVPFDKSPPPTRAEWDVAARVNTEPAKNRPHDCYMKIVREWLKVHCDGRVRGYRDMQGFGKEYRDYYKKIEIDKQADFVVRLERARGMALKIERRDQDAQLFVSWPPAEAQPLQVALQIAKRGNPGDNIVME